MEHRLSGGVLPWTPQQLVHHVGFTANQPKTREDDLTFKSLHTQSCIHFSQLWPFIKKNDTWTIFYFIDTGQLKIVSVVNFFVFSSSLNSHQWLFFWCVEELKTQIKIYRKQDKVLLWPFTHDLSSWCRDMKPGGVSRRSLSLGSWALFVWLAFCCLLLYTNCSQSRDHHVWEPVGMSNRSIVCWSSRKIAIWMWKNCQKLDILKKYCQKISFLKAIFLKKWKILAI